MLTELNYWIAVIEVKSSKYLEGKTSILSLKVELTKSGEVTF